MANFYNPYSKMLLDLDSDKVTQLKNVAEELSPQRLIKRQLISESRLAADRAELIEEDKLRRKAAKAEINIQRLASLEEAIQAQNLENKNYVSHENASLQRHADESAILKHEQEKAWQHTNVEALNRSRCLLSDVTREQLDREAIKNHQTHIRLATEQMKDAQLREAVERSRILAEAAQRENLLLRSSILKSSLLIPPYPY